MNNSSQSAGVLLAALRKIVTEAENNQSVKAGDGLFFLGRADAWRDAAEIAHLALSSWTEEVAYSAVNSLGRLG